ncbi:MAG: adenylate/guanylate cyclase domain-containing protein [Burkholderiales bacterium]
MGAAGDRPADALRRSRRAILVADLVGSVSMMEADEEGAVARWLAFMGTIVDGLLPAHGGHLVKSLGDGFLADFPDASRAVACAFAMHRELSAADAVPGMRIRVGIHVADVYVEHYDVFGDGVNVAARLAELAGASGGTIVSAEARDQITSGLDASIEDLGEQRLRNRQRAVRAFRVWPAGGDAIAPVSLERTHGRPSIAVVPFRVLSHDPGHEFLGDGLAEETIAALSRVADFFVVSRLSSMAFRNRLPGLRSIGEVLGVRYVVSGCLRTEPGRAVLLAELADASTNRVLWSERLSGSLADVFAMQAELAHTMAQRIAPFVRALELRRARVASWEQLDAFGLTLRGIELMHKASRDDFLLARAALEAAGERDPTSPAALAWLAKWHVMAVITGVSTDRGIDSARATELADRALQQDPRDALALSIAAMVSAWVGHDLDGAEARIAEALDSNPNESLAWTWHAATLAWRGKGEHAMSAAERALSLSPLDPLLYLFYSIASTAHLVGERHERAVDLARMSLRENRMHTPSLRALAVGLVLSGRIDEARATVETLRELEPALTAGGFRSRYPGRDSAHAARFADALLAAGLPA